MRPSNLNYYRFLCLSLLVQFALFGCASSRKSVKPASIAKNKNATQSTQQPKQMTLEELGKHFDGLLAEARKEGPAAVRYLETDLYLKANDAALRGESKTAAFLYGQLIKMRPNVVTFKKKYVVELIRLGRLEESLTILEGLLATERKDESIGLILGGIYVALNRYEKARKVYSNLLTHFPGNVDACVFLAKSYLLEKKAPRAIKIIENCRRAKKSAILTYYLGKFEQERGKQKQAIKYFKLALKEDSSLYQAVLAWGLILEGKKAKGKKSLKDALGIYQKFLKKNPNNYAILSRTVQLMFSLGNYDLVLPFAERLLALDPSDLNLKLKLGILYTDARKYDQAKMVFKEILLAVPGSNKVLYYLGALYKQTRDYNKAIKYFSKIAKESDLFYQGHLQIGNILKSQAEVSPYLKERTTKFSLFVEEKAKAFPQMGFDLKLLYVTHLEKIGKVEQAINSLLNLKEEKNYTEKHDYYLAGLYEKIKDVESGLAVIRGILKKNPNNPDALNYLGYSILETGKNYDSAYAYIRKAMKLSPNDGYIRDSLGWYYFKVGKLNKALRHIKKAYELVKGEDLVVTKHLALIYQKMKKVNKARKYYNLALKQATIQSDKAEIKKAIKGLEKLRLPASKKKAK